MLTRADVRAELCVPCSLCLHTQQVTNRLGTFYHDAASTKLLLETLSGLIIRLSALTKLRTVESSKALCVLASSDSKRCGPLHCHITDLPNSILPPLMISSTPHRFETRQTVFSALLCQRTTLHRYTGPKRRPELTITSIHTSFIRP